MTTSQESIVGALKTRLEKSIREAHMPTWRSPVVGIDGLQPLAFLGKGSFGQVQLVRRSGVQLPMWRRRLFALKVISKGSMRRKSRERVLAERDLLLAARGNQWIVQLHQSLQVAYKSIDSRL
jgi:serine/threonine protein kinase